MIKIKNWLTLFFLAMLCQTLEYINNEELVGFGINKISSRASGDVTGVDQQCFKISAFLRNVYPNLERMPFENVAIESKKRISIRWYCIGYSKFEPLKDLLL